MVLYAIIICDFHTGIVGENPQGEDPQDQTPLHYVLQTLNALDMEGLPPGGGLSAK